MASKLREYFSLIKDAGNEFADDNATKLSASLAYYTIFSIGPLLLVVITLLGFFYKKATITAHIFGQMSKLVGNSGAQQHTEPQHIVWDNRSGRAPLRCHRHFYRDTRLHKLYLVYKSKA